MPTSIRVLHVYSGNLFGGVERMLSALASLDVADCQHDFALCFPGKLSAELQAKGAHVELLPPARIRNPLSILRTRSAFKRMISIRKFDAIICHSIWSYCIFAPVVASAGFWPILYMHDIPRAQNWYYRWGWRIPPKLCIANSDYTGKLVAELRPAVSVKVVHPLVNSPSQPPDPALTEALRTELGAKQNELIILQASRFDSWKGHRNLLRALHAVRDLPRWRCWIAGAPQRPQEEAYKRDLLQLVDSLGIADRVAFIGHRDDMEIVLAASDIYCQANETPEPFGMVYVEALYAGKPVVGSALGGALEIVGPECGLLCPPSVGQLAVALRRVLEDDRLRATMSAGGPQRARCLCDGEHFSSRFREALEAL